MQKVIDILTSHATPHTVSAIGNEAIARGALEAGVGGVFSYPGTPSTEISEIFNLIGQFRYSKENSEKYTYLFKNDLYFEYSINEKVAMEKAIAFSIGNKSSLCIMKNVGMNIASDPLMSITYQTISAPLVIVVCDDPGCHSSSNEQDSRYWGKMASVPVFNPANAKDAYEMTKQAFLLSADLHLPVIVRSTTRVSHTRGMLEYNEINLYKRKSFFERLPEHINIPARTAAAHQKLLDKLNSEILTPYFKTCNKIQFEGKKKELAIISSGVAVSYILEVLQRNNLTDKVELFKLGLIFPFPKNDIIQFLKKGYKQVLIVEELDPIIENEIRSITQKENLSCDILGKNFAGLGSTGEFSLHQINLVIADYLNIKIKEGEELFNSNQFDADLPPRPPVLCTGCPHRATYYALKLIVPRDKRATSEKDVILCGDIGCSGLGALPPLRMVDTINHMGMSISMAQGLSQSLEDKNTKVIAMLGDGTFFHSGIASLLNAVYTRSNLMVIIFDNRTIGMTGHQDHPGATHLTKYHEIDIPPLLKGMGISYVETLDPFDTKDTYRKLDEAISFDGVSVLISKAPCVFLPDYKELMGNNDQIIIDHSKCNTCHNHDDLDINCSRNSGPTTSLTRAIAKIKADNSVDARDQSCPANICNHGFFNSILEKDYKTALNMVRDKLLFARTCGDICHRPCELFSSHEAESTIPIKQLKKYVSAIEENFKDFSSSFHEIEGAMRKNKVIGIIGAGPAGLSAAYDLIKEGYDVHVYEKENEAGGLIRYVIPDFRMDKSGFDFEVGQLEKMGVKFHFNTALGKEISLKEITRIYDGVIIAIGLSKAKHPDIINSISNSRKFDAISFLRAFNENTLRLRSGSQILIIGGGNSAIDVARSAKRINKKNEVVLSCIEERSVMPAFCEEVDHAIKEGVVIYSNTYAESIVERDELSVSLHNFNDKSYNRTIQCDYIISAIGQEGNIDEYSELGTKNLSEASRIKVDQNTGFSNYKNVFIAGDVCDGNHISFIGAIASGKRAVVGIKQLLEEYQHDYEGIDALLSLNDKKIEGSVSKEIDLNGDIDTFISQFNLFQSCEKCNHCIDNFGCPAMIKEDGKIVIDYPQCTKCGLCIDVCPNDAIGWRKVLVNSN